jgi:hypothetical protein
VIEQRQEFIGGENRQGSRGEVAEDIVEADGRDQAVAGAGLGQGPDAGGRGLEGLALRQDIEQQIGVD